MGSCLSMNKEPKSAMGMRLSVDNENGKASMVKKNSDTTGSMIIGNTRSQLGSKDEAFFDSQAWLDSDCEDDYQSVNGDFIPSLGNTPVHPTQFPGNSGKKRRLSELFKESLNGERHGDEKNPLVVDGKVFPAEAKAVATNLSLPSKSANGNSEKTHNDLIREDNKSTKYALRCLPKLLSSDGKKKTCSMHIFG